MVKTMCNIIFKSGDTIDTCVSMTWYQVSPMVPFHLLDQDDQNEMQHDFSVMIRMVSSIVSLHLFSQDSQNKVQHDFW